MTAANTSPTASEILVARTSRTPLVGLARPDFKVEPERSGVMETALATVQDFAFGAIERAVANPRPTDRLEGWSYLDQPESLRKSMEDGIDPDVAAIYLTARSPEDLEVLRHRVIEIDSARQVLEDAHGISGFTGRVLGGFADPILFGAFALTGGTVGFVGKGSESLVFGMVKSGLITGGLVGGFEKFTQEVSGDTGRDEMDVLATFLSAAALGGGFGVGGQAFRNAAAKNLKRVQFAQSQAILDDAAGDIIQLRESLVGATAEELGQQVRLTESGLRYFEPVAERVRRIDYLMSVLEGNGYDDATLASVREAMASGEYEAALRNMGKAPLRNAGIEEPLAAVPQRRAALLGQLEAVDRARQAAIEFSRTGPDAAKATTSARESLVSLLASPEGERAIQAGVEIPGKVPDLSRSEIAETLGSTIRKIRELQDKFPDLKTERADSMLSKAVDDTLALEGIAERASPQIDAQRAAILEELSALDVAAGRARTGPTPIEGPPVREGGVVPLVTEQPAVPEIGKAAPKIDPRAGGFADVAPKPAEEGGARPPKVFTDFFAVGKSDPSGGVRDKARFGTVGSLSRSKSEALRGITPLLANEPLLRKSGKPLPDSATRWAHRTNNRMMGLWAREHNVHFEEWFAKHGQKGEGRPAARGRFAKEITRVSRRFATDEEAAIVASEDSALMKMVKFTDDHSKSVEALGERQGVPGLGGGGVRDGVFLKRLYSYPKMNALMDDLQTNNNVNGQSSIEAWFEGSLMSANPELDQAVAAKTARGMVDIIFDSANHTDFERAMTVEGRNPDLLRRALAGKLSEDEIEAVVRGLKGPSAAEKKNIAASGGPRQLLDENFALKIEGRDAPITLADLTVDDAYELVSINTRQIVGAAAEAEIYAEASRVTGRLVDSHDTFVKAMLDAERAAGETGKQRLDSITRNLKAIHNDTVGIRQSADTAMNAFARDLRVAAHDVTSGGIGLAQMPEFGIQAAAAGWRASMQSMPELPSIILRAKNGTLKNELAEELQTFYGQGLEGAQAVLIGRLDESATISQFTGRSFSQKLRRVSRWADIASGLLPVHMTQKNMAAVLFARKMQLLAKTGKGFTDKRLLQLGVTRSRANAVSNMLNKHGSFSEGRGPKLRLTNIHKWTDKQAAADFIVMMDKATNRWVMSPDIGQLAPWMTRDVARIFTQYKVFSLNAYESMFLSGIDMRDAQLFVETALSLTFAGMGYVVQTSVQAQGRTNADQFLADRLTTEKILAAAVQRSGIFNFAPDVTNIVANTFGLDSPFSFRTSGQSNLGLDVKDLVGSNAVTSMINNAMRTTSAGAQAVVWGRTPTQKDVSAGINLIPFMRQMGFLNIGNAVRSSFPESDERN